jgi:threonyl-tRNA synthetase
MALWRALEDWSLEVRRSGGFAEVRTPSLVRKELWETSGHWANYQDNMFVLDDYDHVSGLKPMNCPEEILIYRTRGRSYRDLPMRFADYSTLFRKERTGVLAGMFRVRQLTQDDSHVFCRDDQVDDELRLALSLVRKQYAPFGFEPKAKLATRPEKRIGSDEFWERAEARLRDRLDEDGMDYSLDEGGGAFYGPKVDIFIEDALGRDWQMATIQADYQLPQRFDLEYRSADGGFERPVIVHYAIYGSFERFIGIITEEYAGAFPLWLAPVQVMIVPIADRHLDYAEQVRARLADAGIRVEVDARSERMQAKLREAQDQKMPVMLVLGDRDAEAGAVSPRLRTGDSSQGVPIDEFITDLRARIDARELWPYAEDDGSPA